MRERAIILVGVYSKLLNLPTKSLVQRVIWSVGTLVNWYPDKWVAQYGGGRAASDASAADHSVDSDRDDGGGRI